MRKNSLLKKQQQHRFVNLAAEQAVRTIAQTSLMWTFEFGCNCESSTNKVFSVWKDTRHPIGYLLDLQNQVVIPTSVWRPYCCLSVFLWESMCTKFQSLDLLHACRCSVACEVVIFLSSRRGTACYCECVQMQCGLWSNDFSLFS